MSDDDDLLTFTEAALYAGVSIHTIRTARNLRLRRADVDAWMARRAIKNQPQEPERPPGLPTPLFPHDLEQAKLDRALYDRECAVMEAKGLMAKRHREDAA